MLEGDGRKIKGRESKIREREIKFFFEEREGDTLETLKRRKEEGAIEMGELIKKARE